MDEGETTILVGVPTHVEARFTGDDDDDDCESVMLCMNILEKAVWSYFGNTQISWTVAFEADEPVTEGAEEVLAIVPKSWGPRYKDVEYEIVYYADDSPFLLPDFLKLIETHVDPNLIYATDEHQPRETWHTYFTNMSLWNEPGGIATRDWLMQQQGRSVDDEPETLQEVMHPKRKGVLAVTWPDAPFGTVFVNIAPRFIACCAGEPGCDCRDHEEIPVHDRSCERAMGSVVWLHQ